MTGPAYTFDGRLKAAGEAPTLVRAVHDGTMPKRDIDKPSGAPERPCARCRKPFKPTKRRAMLCYGCFKSGDAADPRAVPLGA